MDVGTNNSKLRNDDYYLGLHQERTSGNAYYELLDEVMTFHICDSSVLPKAREKADIQIYSVASVISVNDGS